MCTECCAPSLDVRCFNERGVAASDYGQCGVLALPGGVTYIQVAAGFFQTVLLRSDGTAVAFGAVVTDSAMSQLCLKV